MIRDPHVAPFADLDDPPDVRPRGPCDRDDDLLDVMPLDEGRNLRRRPDHADSVDDQADLLRIIIDEAANVEFHVAPPGDLPHREEARAASSDEQRPDRACLGTLSPLVLTALESLE